MKKIMLISIIMLMIAPPVQAEIMKIKVAQQDVLESGDPIVGSFSDLSDKEIQAGLDEARVVGRVNKQEAGSKYKVTVGWHTIVSPTGEKKAIKPKFFSHFKIKKSPSGQTIINAGTTIKAKGNKKKVIAAYKNLIKDPSAKSEKSAEEKKKEKKAKFVPQAQGAGGGSGGTIPAVSTPQVASGSPTASVKTRTTIACEPSFDIVSLVAYRQERVEVTDSNGTVLDSGACHIAGQPSAITKTYGCQAPNSINEWYELATFMEGNTIPVLSCTEDTSRPITSTKVLTCSDRIDPVGLQYWKQENTQTLNGAGTVISETGCVDVGSPATLAKTYGCQAPNSINEWYELTASVGGRLAVKQACTEDTTRPITKTVTTACKQRFDKPKLLLFDQQKTVTYNGAGTMISQTVCGDIGVPFNVTKEYNKNCQPFIDYLNMSASDSFRYVATVNGTIADVGNQGCITDKATAYPVAETTTGCSIRDDLPLKFSVEQTKLTYTDGQQTTQTVRGCQDSKNPLFKYPHSFTPVGCTAKPNPVTGRNIPQERLVYFDSASIEHQVTGCSVTGATIGEEFCQGKFANNFATGQSRQLVKTFLTGANGNITYKDAVCSPSASVVYAHTIQGVPTCSYINDDATRLATVQTRTIIDTTAEAASTAGLVVLKPCAPTASAIPYTISSKNWVIVSTQSFPSMTPITKTQQSRFGIYPTITDAELTAALNQTVVWPDGNAINTNGWSKNIGTCITTHKQGRNAITTPGSGVTAFLMTTTRSCTGTRNNYIARTKYKRADGTFFYYDDPLSIGLGANVLGGTTKPAL